MKMRTITATLGIAGIVAASTAALAAAGGSPESDANQQPSRAAAALEVVAPKVAAVRRARVANDAVSSDLVASPLLADGVADLAKSRRLKGRADVWIAPTRDGSGLCHIAYGALNCPPVAQITEQGAAPSVSWGPGRPVVVSGIASDAVSSVTVEYASGETVDVPIIDNQFSIGDARRPVEVRWTGPAGAASVRFPAGIGAQ